MTRIVRLGTAQWGPTQRFDPGPVVVQRLIKLMEQAAQENCDLVVFPELALTAFFPRWVLVTVAEIDAFFERSMPSAETQLLLSVLGTFRSDFVWATLNASRRGNECAATTPRSCSIDPVAWSAGSRKVHLPEQSEPDPRHTHQHLEKRCFEVGDLGFPVCSLLGGKIGMAVCDYRRWPETYPV